MDDGCHFFNDDPSSIKGICTLNPDNLITVESEKTVDGPCPLVVEGSESIGEADLNSALGW